MATAPAYASFLQVRPLRAMVDCPPDEPFSFAIQLANQPQGVPVLVTCRLADAQQLPTGETVYPAAGSTPYSCASWLTLSEAQPTVQPGQTFGLEVTGRVPEGAVGSFHAAILLTPMPPAAGGDETRVGIGLTYAFPVDIIVGATGYTGLRIDDLTLQPVPPQGFASVTAPTTLVVATLHNVGDRVGYLLGEFRVTRAADGSEVARCPVARDPGARVLPKSATLVAAALPVSLEAGEYRVELDGSFDRPPRLMHAARKVRWDTSASTATSELVAEVESYRITVEPAELGLPISQASRTTRRLVVRNKEALELQCTARVTAFEAMPDGGFVPREDDGAMPQVSPTSLRLRPRSAASLEVEFRGTSELTPEREHYWLVVITGRPAGQAADPQEVAYGRALLVASDRTRLSPAKLAIERLEVIGSADETVLRPTLANQGGTALPLAGILTLRQADGTKLGNWPLGGQDTIEILAGASRTVEVTVPGVLPPEGWQGELVYQSGQGAIRLPFEVKPPQTAEAAAEPAAP